ncbi:hypothetical protein [Nocardioides marinquilinus]|uniref:hypothetical protein n=1 Tax=Nocardioides marinquilinus TaxID=1210400 RepID=UPI0031E8B33F
MSAEKFLEIALSNRCVWWNKRNQQQTPIAAACFEADGDQIFVRDYLRDGRAAVAWWQIETRKGQTKRIGGCLNRHGSGTASVCNKNFDEDDVIYLRTGVWRRQPLRRDNLVLGLGCWLSVSSGALYPPGCGDLF